MGCELVGITNDGRSVRFDFADITQSGPATAIVLLHPRDGRLGEAIEVEAMTSTIKPAPSERNDSVEILQAVLMLPVSVSFDPQDGMGVRQYLRREDVVHAVIEAGRR